MRRTWRDLEKDHDVLAEKHDTHVAESERKSSDLEKRVGTLDTNLTFVINELRKEFSEFRDDIKPVLDVFSSTKMSGRALVKIVAFLGAIVAMVVSIKATFFR